MLRSNKLNYLAVFTLLLCLESWAFAAQPLPATFKTTSQASTSSSKQATNKEATSSTSSMRVPSSTHTIPKPSSGTTSRTAGGALPSNDSFSKSNTPTSAISRSPTASGSASGSHSPAATGSPTSSTGEQARSSETSSGTGTGTGATSGARSTSSTSLLGSSALISILPSDAKQHQKGGYQRMAYATPTAQPSANISTITFYSSDKCSGQGSKVSKDKFMASATKSAMCASPTGTGTGSQSASSASASSALKGVMLDGYLGEGQIQLYSSSGCKGTDWVGFLASTNYVANQCVALAEALNSTKAVGSFSYVL